MPKPTLPKKQAGIIATEVKQRHAGKKISFQNGDFDYQRLAGSDLSAADRDNLSKANQLFRARAPAAFLKQAAKGDKGDPILRQVLPSAEELNHHQGFTTDPLGELDTANEHGVIQKYAHRVLLITTAACAIHCRYCFRRHFPYQQHLAAKNDWLGAIDFIRSRLDVREVILSGGDPLSLSNHKLASLLEQLATITQLKTLRVHSRIPVVMPERIDKEFIGLMSDCSLRKVVVIHVNHASELGKDSSKALRNLKNAGCTLLNQSVLLRGVNDDVDTLEALSEALMDSGVLPYYLHLLDPVAGAAHFLVKDSKALAIHKALQNRLPGYLVPKLSREIDGEKSKTILA